MYYYGADNMTTLLLLIIPVILAAFAQSTLKNNYNKYLRLRSTSGMTGAQAARYILDRNGLQNVTIGLGQGLLTDYFDPRRQHINLSPDVYNGSSISSVAVAAHEVGHAIQHKEKYAFIDLRNMILPMAQIGSQFSWIAIFVGFLANIRALTYVGIVLLVAIVLFQLFTLPLEFDASKRALKNLEADNVIDRSQVPAAKSVLKAAAMTYIVGVIAALANLARILILVNNSRRD